MTKHYSLDRRALLQHAALGLAAAPLLKACAGEDGTMIADRDAGSSGTRDGGANSARDGGSETADAGATDAGTTRDGGVSTGGWATGGTAAMTAKASYPNPFSAAASGCALVGTTTEGPCTTDTDLDREDVSEGWTGLPVRLALRVVDTACAPLAGATVKIWHTNIEGIYSGQTPNPGMCNDNNQSYIAQDFFRGVQTTDADGIVYFDTCFPGWYRGRAVHIHFQVKSGNTSYRISQLFFPEAITTEIFDDHPEYESYGQPDTTFSNDNIYSMLPSASRDALVLDVEQMSDGAMLASKTVTVTS
ncbi:MAG: protocatechuate 3,4-dioxygenase [Deltaproteobacteria bacterium]|jgi:protocatechuate 3,4-dioxygenase beta subunit